jgi:glycosyltransferase involved in cell wall biosynthesis/putative flippase GtrA
LIVTARGIPPFVRFIIVGGTAVALNLILYAVLVGVLGMPYLIATAIIFLAGNAYGFAVNRSWTFSLKDRPVRRLVLYYATMLGSLGANLLSMLVLVDGLGIHYLVASVLTSLWLAPVLYLAHRLFAFRARSAPTEADVLMVTNYFPEHGGGVEAVADELSRRIAQDWDVRWLGAGPSGAADGDRVSRASIESWNGIERRTGLPIPIPTPRGIRRIVTGVRGAQVIWIHDVYYLATIVAAVAALASGRPLLVTVHVGAIPYRSRVVRLIMKVVLTVVGATILTRAKAIGFVSDRVRREFETRWNLRETYLIPNGVGASVFRPPSEAERRDTRAKLGLVSERIALFVGRFVERKGLHILHELAREMQSVQWVFAGDGPLNPETWSLPNVHVLLRCDQAVIAQLYGAADLVVLPSIGEGFPLVVQEAVATGARVLVDPSTAAGFPGVEHHLFCEAVAGPGSVRHWRAHVSHLLDIEDAADVQLERVAFARRNWNWNVAADVYGALITGCVQRSSAASSPVPARG